jgi:hypothetical protein
MLAELGLLLSFRVNCIKPTTSSVSQAREPFTPKISRNFIIIREELRETNYVFNNSIILLFRKFRKIFDKKSRKLLQQKPGRSHENMDKKKQNLRNENVYFQSLITISFAWQML